MRIAIVIFQITNLPVQDVNPTLAHLQNVGLGLNAQPAASKLQAASL